MNSNFLPDQSFTVNNAGIRQKKLLHFWIPEDYEKKKYPLILVLHGGTNDPQTSRRYLEKTNDPEHVEYAMAVGEFWEKAGAVVCAPQSPEESHDSWCIGNIRDYLEQVIEEVARRFNINREKVFLFGHSMGGFGAYHIAQLCPDMFAALALSAGKWLTADFKNSISSRIFIIHGRNDAVFGERPHHTDFQYAQAAYKLMKDSGVDVTLKATDGGHGIRDVLPALKSFWNEVKDLKINHHPCVVYISTPGGWSIERLTPVNKRFWLSIETVRPGTIQIYHNRKTQGEHGSWNWQGCSRREFEKWAIAVEKTDVQGACIYAENIGDNTFEVKTNNVDAFSIVMDKAMVDISKAVVVFVNGKEKCNRMIKDKEKITIKV